MIYPSTRGLFRIALASVLLCTFATPALAKIKCWTNSEGIRECGNAVPPEYAQQGHETLNEDGIKVDTSARAKTMEELAAEREAAKAAQQAAIEKEKRAAADRVLLDTFASEDDLILTRDGQIAHLDSQIRLTESHIEKLQNNFDQMIENAADFERRGEQPPAEVVANIDNVRGQIAENEAFIVTKRNEQQLIRERFEADIKRFLELKAQR